MTVSQRRLPAEIYWRRRLLLLALVIALVWIVLQVTGDDGDAQEKASTTPRQTVKSTPTASPTPTAPPVPEVQVNGIVDVALTTATTACDPEKIRITPTVKGGQLTKGPVDIGLVISSTDTAACTLQPDDADAIAVISANGTPIWDSTVCKSSLLSVPVEVSPQWATLATVQWTGRGSGASCLSSEGYATPGKYTLQIGTLGGEPGKTTFTLDPRPEPVATTPPPAPATPDPAAVPDPAATPDPAAVPAPAATPGSDVPAPLPEPE